MHEEPRWRRYLRFVRRNVGADVDDELGFHFEQRVAEFIAAGATRDEAEARARARFGDAALVREELRSIGSRAHRRRDRRDVVEDQLPKTSCSPFAGCGGRVAHGASRLCLRPLHVGARRTAGEGRLRLRRRNNGIAGVRRGDQRPPVAASVRRRPGVVGRTVEINRQRTTIVGIAPAGFDGPDLSATDVWLPLAAHRDRRTAHGIPVSSRNIFRVVGRVAPGTSDAWAERRRNDDRAPDSCVDVRRGQPVNTVRDSGAFNVGGADPRIAAPSIKPAPEVAISTRLVGVTLIVLLIACANVASLLLARALSRRARSRFVSRFTACCAATAHRAVAV